MVIIVDDHFYTNAIQSAQFWQTVVWSRPFSRSLELVVYIVFFGAYSKLIILKSLFSCPFCFRYLHNALVSSVGLACESMWFDIDVNISNLWFSPPRERENNLQVRFKEFGIFRSNLVLFFQLLFTLSWMRTAHFWRSWNMKVVSLYSIPLPSQALTTCKDMY